MKTLRKLTNHKQADFCKTCKDHCCHTCGRGISIYNPGSTYWRYRKWHWICKGCSE